MRLRPTAPAVRRGIEYAICAGASAVSEARKRTLIRSDPPRLPRARSASNARRELRGAVVRGPTVKTPDGAGPSAGVPSARPGRHGWPSWPGSRASSRASACSVGRCASPSRSFHRRSGLATRVVAPARARSGHPTVPLRGGRRATLVTRRIPTTGTSTGVCAVARMRPSSAARVPPMRSNLGRGLVASAERSTRRRVGPLRPAHRLEARAPGDKPV